MSNSAEKAFRLAVQDHLGRLDNLLIPVLSRLAAYKFPAPVVAVDFEVFSDSFTSQFPARAFFMDNSNSEHFVYVDGKATYPSPVDPELIALDCVYSQDLEDEFVAQESELDPWNIATEEFIPWFSACWDRAGGRSLSLAATISHHDSIREFNLQSGSWQQRGAAYSS